MKMRYFAIVLILALSACQAVSDRIVLDANTAITMAKKANTPEATARAGCYASAAVTFGTPPIGGFSLYEQLSEVNDSVHQACAPVVAGVALMILQIKAAIAGQATTAAIPALGLGL